MSFTIDDHKFDFEMDLSDSIEISSLNKKYNVSYSNKDLNELVNEIYLLNDFIFVDRNVFNLSEYTFKNRNVLIFDATEESKNIESVLKLTDNLYHNSFTKTNKLIVIGGGITQDVGGFAAAIYKRGIKWVYIPTTVLSMTDSCIGSKVTINRSSKNILGVFIAPDNVYISDYFLSTLSPDDILSGLGESLKLSLIGGITVFNYFKEKLAIKDYISIIKISSLVKKQIIEYDEFEEHDRKVLNYGHTIGHAIEATTNYFIPHGIAVLIGMFIKQQLFSDNKLNDEFNEINKLIIEMINPKFFNIEINFNNLIKHILSDKKNKGDQVCFILLDRIGKSIITYKHVSEFESKLNEIISYLFARVTYQ